MKTETDAARRWQRLRAGMFIHFGPNTLAGVGWGDGKLPADGVVFPRLDCRQWASMMAEAGLRYAVLTTKHHDGFCLWPTRLTEYCIRSSPQRRDIVGEFVSACREFGIAPGLYYSLWDMNQPLYSDDAAYAQVMKDQIGELLGNYGDIVELWFDGGWDKEHPTRQWAFDPAWRSDPELAADLTGRRWDWAGLYGHIKRLQPDCLVINNSSSDRPAVARLEPVDLLTLEHPNFVWQDKLYQPPQTIDRPVETCATLSPDWFHKPKGGYPHPSVSCIADWYEGAWALGGNLLLNVGPNAEGLLPEVHRRFLVGAGRRTGLI